MRSLSYFLTLLVIRIKGVKSKFSRDPIDFMELRKEDIHLPNITGAESFLINDSSVTELRTSTSGNGLIIFIHGGAFVYGPSKHHWDAGKKTFCQYRCIVWMVDYPKAPENKIDIISFNIDQVYAKAVEKFEQEKIILIGDSVEGTLIAALTQRLIKMGTPLPSLLILISPVMDSSFK